VKPFEVEKPLSIMDNDGKPVHFGWARAPHFRYNPALLSVPRRRVSESDRYIVFSPTHLLVLEIIDNGYMGYTGLYLVSMRDKKRWTYTSVTPFSMGGFALSPSSETGTVRLHGKKRSIDFITMAGGARIVKADIPHFDHHRNLRGEVVLLPPASAEPIVTTMPWRRDDDAFRCSLHSPWYTVEGVIQLGATETIFTKGNAWGIFDWARGIRPAADTRYWIVGAGVCGNKLIGICAGFDSSDSGRGTENAFFINGAMHKLDQVTFHISPSNWLLPWHFTSNDQRLEMTFVPDMEWEERSQIFFFSTKRRQLYGSFFGQAILENGSPLDFRITGFAERRKTRF
jgi:hypothetical protein